MRALVTAAQSRAIDARAIETLGLPGLILMENAGLKTVQAICERLGGAPVGVTAAIACGKGNNGGDGFVIARHLLNGGARVRAYLFGKKSELRGDARVNVHAYLGLGGELVEQAGGVANLERFRGELLGADLVVDALLGTGLSSAIKGPLAKAIGAINQSAAFVVAADIPSGIDADTGAVLGAAVEADLTCTYGAMKLGQWQQPGRAHCGELVEVDISIPPALFEEMAEGQYLLGEEDLWPGLFHRPPDAHKGHFGHLLVVAGSHGKSGAGVLACRGAHRMGAGRVTLALPAALESVVAPQSPETMTALLGENAAGGISEGVSAHLSDLLAERTAALVGPGIPTDPESDRALRRFLERARAPLVLDADGLNLLARLALPAGELASETIILTPHPGEMSRLTGKGTAEIQADRPGAARDLAEAEGVICVLKGAGTVIADPDGNVFVCPISSPALASAGTGDVLAGMIAGLLVQEGVAPLEACLSAVLLHALAAERIARRHRGAGPALLAGELPDELPALLGEIHEGLHHHHEPGTDGPGAE